MARILSVLLLLLSVTHSFAATTATKKTTPRRTTTVRTAKKPVVKTKAIVPANSLVSTRRTSSTRRAVSTPASRRAPVKRARASRGRRGVSAGVWKVSSFADSTVGDVVDGEDLNVRRAAVEAMHGLNGTVVVVDPNTGRILTIVNQQLALKSGFIPCSTIKVVVGMAALSEGLIDRTTPMRLSRRLTLDLTEALARSDNQFFANLGVKMGFEKVSYYARLFGLGERATLGLEGEMPGRLPTEPPKFGGVGMMCSFGEGITLTPLQLAAMMSSIANGGTLYYLQYPQDQEQVANFVPRVKRQLDIAQYIPDIKPGMMGAVEYGTARRAAYDPNEPILGKTGTCTDRNSPTHMGWFGSFNDVEKNKLVVIVMLTGGRHVNGPVASGVAGEVYKRLSGQQYFAQERQTSPVQLVQSACCLQ
ncbi:MAG TPA: penicillin-binding transpeptidase domain-containing protein [Bryobacteraceae bacterium]|nr:penicillin-binding transpeptidase domain-containing protein [Bryobacteraceae bacterium]